MLPGCHPPNAAADGAATAEPNSDSAGAAGSPLDTTDAAGTALSEPPPISRRAAAAAAHTTVAAAGESPLPPAPSHDRNELFNLDAGATRAAVITGAAAVSGSATGVRVGVAADTPESLSATTDSDGCASGSDTDSGAIEVDPGTVDGEVMAGA
jgi:hypothetical protein